MRWRSRINAGTATTKIEKKKWDERSTHNKVIVSVYCAHNNLIHANNKIFK